MGLLITDACADCGHSHGRLTARCTLPSCTCLGFNGGRTNVEVVAAVKRVRDEWTPTHGFHCGCAWCDFHADLCAALAEVE